MLRRTLLAGWRQLLLLAVMLLCSGVITRKLVYWQVTEHTTVSAVAARIYDAEADIPAPRGYIYDSQGVPLVTNEPAYLVAADPQVVGDLSRAAAALAPPLHRDPQWVLAQLRTPNREYVVLAHQVNQAAVDSVRAVSRRLKMRGIILQSSWRASYPQGALASPLLGFVDNQGVGQYGLEQSYDSWLTGTPGTQLALPDTSNRPLPVGIAKPRPAVPGASLSLTLNSNIQTVVEQRLSVAIQKYGAESGTAIVMAPHSGAILAMASLPSFDPGHFGQYDPVADAHLFKNWAVQSYQPGSTFKVVSIASGLDYGAFRPDSVVYDPGYFHKYGILVQNWEVGKGWGYETPMKMLRYSANVGMAQFADEIGPPAFYNYLTERFGFGQRTAIDVPDESPGALRTPQGGDWQPEDLLTNSYGQGIDVTPLQLITAVGALANGGWRMRPYLVQQIMSSDGHVLYTAQPRRVAQAVSPATATTMTNILRQSGDAWDAETVCSLTKDYPTANKTGTATIEQPAAYALDKTKGTVASLVGYPATGDPKFVMLVTLRHPQPGPTGSHIYGATTAGPAWHDIAMALYRILKIPAQPGSTPAKLSDWQGPHWYGCDYVSH